jgi:hypothetical protein
LWVSLDEIYCTIFKKKNKVLKNNERCTGRGKIWVTVMIFNATFNNILAIL